MNCGGGHRCGSDPTLLWLWCGPAAAAPVPSLAWELLYVSGVALKSKGKKKKKVYEIPKLMVELNLSSLLYNLMFANFLF